MTDGTVHNVPSNEYGSRLGNNRSFLITHLKAEYEIHVSVEAFLNFVKRIPIKVNDESIGISDPLSIRIFWNYSYWYSIDMNSLI